MFACVCNNGKNLIYWRLFLQTVMNFSCCIYSSTVHKKLLDLCITSVYKMACINADHMRSAASSQRLYSLSSFQPSINVNDLWILKAATVMIWRKSLTWTQKLRDQLNLAHVARKIMKKKKKLKTHASAHLVQYRFKMREGSPADQQNSVCWPDFHTSGFPLSGKSGMSGTLFWLECRGILVFDGEFFAVKWRLHLKLTITATTE